jgi:hypothetical protein
MKARLEITSGVIRVFKDDADFGDPFVLAIAMVGHEDTAILKALTNAQPVHRDFVAIRQCLAEYGFTKLEWNRHRKDGQILVRSFQTAREVWR